MKSHRKKVPPKGKPIVEACPRCDRESVARMRVGKTVFTCVNGHRHSKVLKFHNAKEKR